jgi:hypothetical protein
MCWLPTPQPGAKRGHYPSPPSPPPTWMYSSASRTPGAGSAWGTHPHRQQAGHQWQKRSMLTDYARFRCKRVVGCIRQSTTVTPGTYLGVNAQEGHKAVGTPLDLCKSGVALRYEAHQLTPMKQGLSSQQIQQQGLYLKMGDRVSTPTAILRVPRSL